MGGLGVEAGTDLLIGEDGQGHDHGVGVCGAEGPCQLPGQVFQKACEVPGWFYGVDRE